MDPTSAQLRHALSLFDGFPYLNIRVAPAIYHITLLPAAADAELLGVSRRQALTNQLKVCLVLAADRAIYFDLDGQALANYQPPLGGNIVTGQLAGAVDGDDGSEEFRQRVANLATLVEFGRARGGYIFGDLTKGGHRASADERRQLQGCQADGTPRGLSRCGICGDWAGVCLDPSEQFAGMVMTVHCYCANQNRCARCQAPLYERRLNANYYNPSDGSIWHVPGFCGFRHSCASHGLTRTIASQRQANGKVQ